MTSLRLSFLILFATLYVGPAVAAWQKVAENDRLTAYFEPSQLDSSGTATLWVMYDYKTEQTSATSGRRYRSQKGQQEMDCKAQRSRTIFFTWHVAQMGNGAVVYTGRTAMPWEPNSPGSIARALASIVCASK